MEPNRPKHWVWRYFTRNSIVSGNKTTIHAGCNFCAQTYVVHPDRMVKHLLRLSKALRNRFTEIWCSTNFTFGDLVKIVHKKMLPLMKLEPTLCDKISRLIVEYFYLECVGHIIRTTISISDMIFASELFIALIIRKNWHLIDAAIASTYGYVIPLLLSSSVRVSFDVEQVKSELALKCVEIFSKYGLAVDIEIIKAKSIMEENEIILRENCLSIGSLLEIPFGPHKPRCPPSFSFNVPTCRINTFYITRALDIDKPILLEGSPGAGKSSLIVSLAMATGQSLIRLNLYEQTLCSRKADMESYINFNLKHLRPFKGKQKKLLESESLEEMENGDSEPLEDQGSKRTTKKVTTKSLSSKTTKNCDFSYFY